MNEQEELRKLIETYSKPRPKVTPAKIAWGFLVWFVWFLFVVFAGGWLISILWNNIAADLMLAELSFVGGVSVAMIVVVISRIVTYTRVK
jgi:hypothetical protein